MICRTCGTENAAAAKFCSECGTALTAAAPQREERKVVTVLFADLVGFTSQAEKLDPEEVRAILRPYHERLRADLERFGGTVEKFIGDAVMAVFGAPVAHEDDPERAVRAALAIRDWAAHGGVEVRIGVNTGEALVSLDAQPQAGEGMVAGDVVNTAARLQSAAPVNGVLVGEMTHRATRGSVDYREHAPVAAKGKSQPVPTWQAVDARSPFGVDVVQQSTAPLVGRARELALLTDALGRARSSREPQLVTLVGVPGIGKSRLVYELMQLAAADAEPIRWRQGRCLPYGDGITFWALGEIIKSHAGILEDDSVERAAEKLRQLTDDPWVESHLRPLVGLGGEIRGADRLGEAFAAWTHFFESLTDDAPLVVVVEDLHWADEQLLDFVDHLVDRAVDCPLLVVATARPELLERRPGWGGGKPNALTLSLSALTDDDTARILAAHLERSVLPAETQQAVLARAGGNPLFAEQYARMLAERGDTEGVPESVQAIVAARLDALGPAEKALLQDAAVYGKVFWAGALGDDEGLLRGLERKEFVRRQRRSSVAGETEYAFRHALLRDVAYGQIPRAERAEKHRRAAEWLEALGRPEDHAELLAHHYLAALELARAAGTVAPDLDERALQALDVAGDRAATLNAFEAAAGFYASALELVADGDPRRPHLLFRLGRARFHGEEAGHDELTEAAAGLLAAGERATAAEAETLLVELVWKQGRRDEAFAHLDRALELVAEEPASRAKAFTLSQKSRYLMLAGDHEQALASAREALAMADELGLDEVRAHALTNIGTTRHTLGDSGGIADLEESIAISRAANSTEVLRAYMNLSSCYSRTGETAESHRVAQEGLAAAERFGHAGSIRWFRGGRASDLYTLGDWDAALASADSFIAECEQSPHYLESSNRNIRALIRLARDDVAGALEETEHALALGRTAKDPQALYPALLTRTRVLVESGDRTAGDALFMEFLVGRKAEGMPFVGGAVIAPLALELGRGNELRKLLGSFAKQTHPAYVLATEILDGELTGAADKLHDAGELPFEAELRLDAARALAEAGRRAEADVQLQQALAFFRSVGAKRYVREAESLLAATA